MKYLMLIILFVAGVIVYTERDRIKHFVSKKQGTTQTNQTFEEYQAEQEMKAYARLKKLGIKDPSNEAKYLSAFTMIVTNPNYWNDAQDYAVNNNTTLANALVFKAIEQANKLSNYRP